MIHVQRDGYQVGDHIAVWDWDTKTARTTAVVTAVAPLGHGEQELTLNHDITCKKVGVGDGQPFGRDAEADGIDRVINLDVTGEQTTVRDCKYQVFRAKCLNLKASNCTVERCAFYDCWEPPVSASPEWYFEEGPPVHDLTVRDCTFTNCVHGNMEVGTISGEQMPPVRDSASPSEHPEFFGHETMNIVIEGNKFSDYGAHISDNPWTPIGDAIRVLNAANVTIIGNDLGSPAPTAPRSPKIILVGCTNVKLARNTNVTSAEIDQH